MPRHSHDTPKRARRRLVLRLPHYSPQDKAAESSQFRRNTGHLGQCAWDGCDDFLSLFFLRFILPDSAVEHVLLYVTAHCSQNPPRILQNEPDTDEADDDGCYEAWFEVCHPDGALAHLYPPLPDAGPCAPSRPLADPRDDGPSETEQRINDHAYEVWRAANPHPLLLTTSPPPPADP